MKRLFYIMASFSIIFSACSNKGHNLKVGKVAGATVGATGGAMIGGMMGLLIAGGGTNKNTSSIVATSALIGAITGGVQGYSLFK